MSVFLFVRSHSEPISDVLDIDSLVDFLPLVPSEQTVTEFDRAGICALYHFRFGAPLDRDAIQTDDGAICLLAGNPLIESQQSFSTLDDIKRCPRSILGDFAAVALTADGYLCGFKALSGGLPIYYRQWEGGFAVSNRLSLLLALKDQPPFDPVGLSSVVSNGYVYGNNTTFCGVKKLLPGEVVSEKAGRVVLHRPDLNEYYNPLDYHEVRDEIFRSLDTLGDEIKSLKDFSGSRSLPLSGGKDSRLIAGMIKRAKMSDQFNSFTNGVLYSPDVMSAQLVAEHLGLEHRVNRPRIQWSSSDISKRILNTLIATEGQVSLFDAGHIGQRNALAIGGHQNGLRDTYFRFFEVDDDANNELILDEIYKHVPINAHRLLSGDGHQMVHDNLKELVEKFRADGCPVNKIPVAFMWQIRTGGWVSIINGAGNVGASIVNPLLSSAFMKLACALPDDLIDAEVIHFIITNEASPELINIPFADQNWRSDLPDALKKIGYDAPNYRSVKEFRSNKIFVNASNPYLPNVVLESYKLLSRFCLPVIEERSRELPLLDIENIKIVCREDSPTTVSRMISQQGVFLIAFLLRYGRNLFRRSMHDGVLSDIANQLDPSLAEPKVTDEQKIAFLERQIKDYEAALVEYCLLERETRKEDRAFRQDQVALRQIDIVNKSGFPINYSFSFFAPGDPEKSTKSATRKIEDGESFTFGVRAQGKITFLGQTEDKRVEKAFELCDNQLSFPLTILPHDLISLDVRPQRALREIHIINESGLPLEYSFEFYSPDSPDELKKSSPRKLEVDEIFTFGIRAHGKITFLAQSLNKKTEKSFSISDDQNSYRLTVLPSDLYSVKEHT